MRPRRLSAFPPVLVGGAVLAGLAGLTACGGGDGHASFGRACDQVEAMGRATADPSVYAEHLQAAQKDAEGAVHLNPDWGAARDLLDVLDSAGVTPAEQTATASGMCKAVVGR